MWCGIVPTYTKRRIYGVHETDGVKHFISFLRAIDGERVKYEVIPSSVRETTNISEQPVYEQEITHDATPILPCMFLGLELFGELRQLNGITFICFLSENGEKTCKEVIPSTIGFTENEVIYQNASL